MNDCTGSVVRPKWINVWMDEGINKKRTKHSHIQITVTSTYLRCARLKLSICPMPLPQKCPQGSHSKGNY